MSPEDFTVPQLGRQQERSVALFVKHVHICPAVYKNSYQSVMVLSDS